MLGFFILKLKCFGSNILLKMFNFLEIYFNYLTYLSFRFNGLLEQCNLEFIYLVRFFFRILKK